MQMGTHRFFALQPGRPDRLTESGKFIDLWKQQQDGSWKLARVISYITSWPRPATDADRERSRRPPRARAGRCAPASVGAHFAGVIASYDFTTMRQPSSNLSRLMWSRAFIDG